MLDLQAASQRLSTSRASKKAADLSTTQGLIDLAATKGVTLKQEEPKLSVLQRIGRGLSALEPNNAIYQSKYNGKNFAIEYVKDIFQEAGSAITGREMQDDKMPKKTFKDILVKEGMKDREGKLDLADVAGFFGDVLTDPSTFFGGAIVKGAGKGIGATAKVVEKVGMKVLPKQTALIKGAIDLSKDAAGRLFTFGYGTTKGLSDDVMGYVNTISGMKEGIGTKYAKLFKELPKETQENLFDGLYKIRNDFGKKREALIEGGMKFEDATKKLVEQFNTVPTEQVFNDPNAIRFFNQSLLPELQRIKGAAQKATGLEDEMMMKYYYPSIKNDTLNGFNTAIKVSKEGRLKRFKGALTEEEIIQNPAEAYATTAYQLAKDGFTKKELGRWVKNYGLGVEDFNKLDDAEKAMYEVIKEKGIFGKEVGYLKKDDARFIKDLFDPSYKALSDLANATGFDAFTGLFKKSVTGLFPSFHVRNFVSGTIQNYETLGMQALNPKNIADGVELSKKVLKGNRSGLVDIGGKMIKAEKIIKPFEKKFGISSSYIKDYGWETMQKMTEKPSKFNPFTHARAIGNAIETQQKMTAYVTALRKGYNTREALTLAERAGFDYGKLTPFEKNIMRRLIPFYSFSRKNLELQAKTFLEHPERIGNLTKLGRSLGSPQGLGGDEEGKGLQFPDWMRDSFMASAGKSAYGLPQVISGFGTPIEDQASLYENGVMGILSRLNPLLRVPLERATGKDFFRNRDLKTVYTADEYAEAPQIIKDWLKIQEVPKPIYRGGKKTGETRINYVADPERLQIARALFTSRGVTFIHTLFGNSELSTKGRIIKSLTGLRPYEVDEEATKYFEDRKNYQEFRDLLKKLGIINSFEKVYEPTGKEKRNVKK